MVAFHSISNAILIRPFQSKHDAHRIAAYKDIYDRLAAVNAAPALHIMDNEASVALKAAITANGCTYQLVPPNVHRRNAAERAIRTFKDHFLSILAGAAPNFPADRWDLLLPHAELTLNLLRSSNTQPTQSAWETLFGRFNFDATPMGPAGCRVLIHNKPGQRRSWDFRSRDGFYIGPTLHHYRCYKVLGKESGAVAISDAIKFRHHYLPEPSISIEDKIIHALNAINHTVAKTSNTSADDQLAAIEALREILQTYRPQHTTTAVAPPVPLPPAQPPGVRTPPGVQSPPRTRLPEHPHAPPEWTVVQTRRQSMQQHEQPPRPDQHPVAMRTRSHTTNVFALLAHYDDDDSDKPSGHQNTNLALPVLDADTGTMLEHRQLRKHPAYKAVWDRSYANELGRLCQGIGKAPNQPHPTQPTTKRIDGTNTFRPIHYADIPSNRRTDVTYTRVVCDIRPQKSDPHRTRITIGGNRICYPGDTGTKTGSLELCKLLFNSVISTANAKFASFDLANFYLGTPLDRPEYVRIQLSVIPQEFIDEYNLTNYTHNGWIYFEISKGVYGLKQAGKLANDLLTTRLAASGYYQCETTPGLWRHTWRPIVFVLIVDDFGIQYVGKRHADHLLTALQTDYTVTTDWNGTKFAGIDLAWDYTKRTCRLTMNSYIADLLLRYNHKPSQRGQHAPHAHRAIVYGANEQYIPEPDTSPLLNDIEVKRVQAVVGSLLYYARAVDNKLLATLSTISAQQAKATQNTTAAVDQLLDYVATYPADGTTYRASGMVLAAHSDASFLTETGSRSRAGAHIYLTENDPIPRQNGPVHTMSQIIKFVMASAAEAELGALYLTARQMVPLRAALEEMGWKQPPSPVQTDNNTASGFVNDTIIQRRIKMIWMRIHWLRCRAAQAQFRFYWDKGTNNMADYHTKHHPPAYHIAHRATHAG